MADLTRIARPWLTSLRHHQPMPILIRTTAASPHHAHAHALGALVRRGITTTPACYGSTRAYDRDNKRAQKQRMSSYGTQTSLLLPYTIVPPPLQRFPRSPIKAFELLWLLIRNRTLAWWSTFGVVLQSMGAATNRKAAEARQGKKTRGWFARPLFKARRRACVPDAKAMHIKMCEAVAAGDKETLRQICTGELYRSLAGAVDARPQGQKAKWELVRYDRAWRYPRIADFRVMAQRLNGGTAEVQLTKQVVVSISSVQRLSRVDADRLPVPGADRERRMLEHIVLRAHVDDDSYVTGPWKIWGTLPEMTLEKMQEDDALYKDLVDASAQG
ncbi:hypothetical protein F4777DRAFT_546721 [Nemania sp. FL0916]|nr:hypothetical protein F4777DRAFT_546721 [Nemania sp. FL0916]